MHCLSLSVLLTPQTQSLTTRYSCSGAPASSTGLGQHRIHFRCQGPLACQYITVNLSLQ